MKLIFCTHFYPKPLKKKEKKKEKRTKFYFIGKAES